MPFQTYADGQVLTAAQLNADNQTTLDLNTSTPQTIASPITINGGLSTTSFTATGLRTFQGGLVEAITIVQSGATYTITATDRFVMCNTGATITINLPGSPTTGRLLTIKDMRGTASAAAPVNINAAIDGGAAPFRITTAYGRSSIIFNGSSWTAVD